MKLLIFWDLYWRIWRRALAKELPILKHKYGPDFVIVNWENMTSGRWPIEKHVLEIEKLWVDVITSWDHIFDNYKGLKSYLDSENSKLIRPANFFESDFYKIPLKWYKIIEKNNKKLLVINLMWSVFMSFSVYNPFLKIDEILKELWEEKFDWIIVDFHKETTSEWYWMVNFLDWRVSLVYWTHTHVQTNDDIIFPLWTWFISDIGMNWSFNSVIWADYESVKKRFLTWISKWKMEQSLDENYLVSWLFVEIWDNKKVVRMEKIRINNKL